MSYIYDQLNEFLGQRTKRFIKRSPLQTYVVRDQTDLVIYLVNTPIMTYRPDGSIVLYSGGWRTSTTKQRMNDYLPNDWHIWQDKSLWWVTQRYVWYGDNKEYPFAENIELYPDGSVIGENKDPKAEQKLIRQVNKYSKDFIAALDAGEVPAPSSGDCWLCSLHDEQGNFIYDRDHILGHIEEKYYVPTLLYNAITYGDNQQAAGIKYNRTPDAAKMFVQACWNGDGRTKKYTGTDYIKRALVYALKVYIKRQLGLAY